jgi:hypothetical protein
MSRLSWNEIKVRAADFARSWAGAHYEKGETQTFYNEFFEVFGIQRKSVSTFEHAVKKLSGKTGFIDLFWPGKLLVEQKSLGLDLDKAREQALDYCASLPPGEHPEYLLLCDFQTFRLEDLHTRETVEFTLAELPQYAERFGFLIGTRRKAFAEQDPVNIAAAEQIGKLHDELLLTGYSGHDLDRLMVRLVFCLFADDTGIYDYDTLSAYLQERTSEDGSDLGSCLAQLFQVLDTPNNKRYSALDQDLAQFPYISGGLFSERLPIPNFTRKTRKILLDACNFDWSRISPAIFGSLFQSVMSEKERREKGAHYTTEENILKGIGPLFVEELREELNDILAIGVTAMREAELQRFHQKLANFSFFDPACGCGNFLIITYREIRELETDTLLAIRDCRAPFSGVVALRSLVDVHQFYGIEINEFAAEISRVALWMMDHIMNLRLGQASGAVSYRIPLKASPNILTADSLDTDWPSFLPPDECSYIIGNPPFIGSSNFTPDQRKQMSKLAPFRGGGDLDFVCAWFLKVADYLQGDTKVAFVSTNSITQGVQAAPLWQALFGKDLEIIFAHRSFAWGSDAKGKAAVHVVILGLAKSSAAPATKRLFSYPDLKGRPIESQVRSISPYLIDASLLADPHITVSESYKQISGLPEGVAGLKTVLDGNYFFTRDEMMDFIAAEPLSAGLFRLFLGSEEFLNNKERFILHLDGVSPGTLAKMPLAQDRMKKVSDFRAKSKDAGTRKLSAYPTKYYSGTLPTTPFLLIPKVSSERREYVPMGFLAPPTMASDLVSIVPNATKALFALLTSAMSMAWMRTVGSRMKSDYRYTIGGVYNTFPAPDITPQDEARLERLADDVLAARANYPDDSLADLYDPNLMPPDLRKAHEALDKAVDRLYDPRGFATEQARVEHLLGRYAKMVNP